MDAVNNNQETLLKIIRTLSEELHPTRKTPTSVSLDSSLEKDLGFDSLARVELLSRIDRTFEVTLSEQVLATAESPRDLLHALSSAGRTVEPALTPEVRHKTLDEVAEKPDQAGTLVEVLEWHVRSHPDRSHIFLYGAEEKEEEITYHELLKGAEAVASGLIEQDLEPGRAVAIMLPTSRDYFSSFFGILLAGGVPVPLYPPFRKSQIEDHLKRHASILKNALASFLITLPEAQAIARLLKSQVESLQRVVTVKELSAPLREISRPAVQAEDIAFLQYTSGSTGIPKGVMLTHANLLANIRAMGEAVQADSTDVFVSWLPLYHDMGLIGAWLGSLYYAIQFVVMSPLTFLTRPNRWLWAIHRHRGTISGGLNFAYELCLRQKSDQTLEGLDLSSWRMAFNGAEPVSPETIQRFQKRYAKYGFKPGAMAPVYGLAESSVGLAFPPPDRGAIIDRIEREPFMRSGRAVPTEEDDPHALRFAACGQPITDHEIRIVDAAGREAGEREEGRLQFKGPSATQGYFRNPEETRHLFDGEWLDSGDRAYMVGADIYLTGRSKDIIIRAGRNIYPHELEEAIGNIEGVRKGCVAVFGSTDPVSGTEKVVILAETRKSDQDQLDKLENEINTAAVDLLGSPPDDIVLAPPHTVLKTSSGKIRRTSCREIYEGGAIGERQKAVWQQFARLLWAGIRPEFRRLSRVFFDLLFAGYAWGLFLTLAVITWTLVAVTPKFSWRYTIIRKASRLLIRLTGTPFSVVGLENLKSAGHCILVSNHASYIDSFIMVAALPYNFIYVAKRELTGQFISRVFLERIHTAFVERFDKQRGMEDARQTSQAVHEGKSLVFFSEGTFRRMPGLRPFYMGAFIAAAETSVPVIPVVIRGTRSILRAGHLYPRRGSVSVTVCAPIYPQGTDWASAIQLRDATRAEILKHYGEPDLA